MRRVKAHAGRAKIARVLVVTDDEDLGKYIRLTLNHGSFTTHLATSSADALKQVKTWKPQLAIVEAELEKANTIPLLGRAHAGRDHIGIMALTRRGNLKIKLQAFEQGADDIIQVPFAPEEFIARALAIARRTTGAADFTAVMHLGDLEIDLLHRKVSVKGHEIHLTALEQSLLYLLAANAGEVLTRERILDALWGVDYVADSNVVEAQIRLLRLRLQNDARHPRYIETVPGRGYRFIAIETQTRTTR